MKIKLSKSQWEQIGVATGWLGKQSQISDTQFKPQTYTYHINLDERGSFYADVRNSNGNTVFKIKAGNELSENESSIFEDGFMKDKFDLKGLKDYLIHLGIMNEQQSLVMG